MFASMQATTRHSPTVRFRVDEFDRLTEALGHRNDEAKAEFIGCDPSTIWRQRNGKHQPSSTFVARVLAALPDVPPAQLFDFGISRDRAA